MPDPEPLSVDEHLALILDRIHELPAYDQPLLETLGLPVVADIISPLSLPNFDNSAMDGYAVVFRDVAAATPANPVHLPVVGEIAAGQTKIFAISPGTAVRIMTGAPIPAGCDAVVPVEHTDNGVAKVLISQAPTEGQHIRRAGEDVRAGDVILKAGDRIDARKVGLLASVGLGRVATRPRPRVVIMSTGSELVEPGDTLGRDSIYDSNSYLLAATAKHAGAIAYRVSAAPDDPATFTEALSDQLVRADLVVTSGGVSKGTHDVVKEALAKLGTVSFHEVAMQPGKPQGFGVIGEDSTPIFTLPGNPVSAYVSFELFVVPALRKMMGRTPLNRTLVRAQLTTPVTSMKGRRQYLRGVFEPKVGGSTVTPAGGAGSHLLGGLSQANALIILGEDVTSAQAGTDVPVMLLDRDY
ncbi:molybdopterin molybdenumtransferase MoeA [Nocardioides marmoriginsengisoli]|uniref:Molybdopterin molybdenumtransferase n=1 Tax=Nocardioides marmoriginsengisoli TaxID=661483 RepID=A0A3N0CG07_9ACTN|nr:gephyrin-like molybdotransferase Glp [Nocardioides marmoriginsengisoli]RNL62410.1 molybdopterin molybdenumtransferase MoeA [Nocardioides marmoriginsengisoli]